MRLRAFRFRIYPTKEQESRLETIFGSVRFVYNWGLETKIGEYQEGGKSPDLFDLMKRLPALKTEHPWLSDSIGQSLQASLRNLDRAYTSFFRKKTGFPKFKSKRGRQSFHIVQDLKVDFDGGRISIPKVGWIRCRFHRRFEGKIKTSTISRSETGKYYISILVEEPIDIPDKPPLDENRAIGIDVGLKTFITTSDGRKIENPRHLRNGERRLKRLQRSLARKKAGSKRRSKAKHRLAIQHERVANQRADFLHKVTHELSNESQVDTLCVEDLSVKGMMGNHHLAKSIGDAAWGAFFSFLSYKCEWRGKNVLTIGRFDPSSKTCSICGLVHSGLKLSDRRWACRGCGTTHDRDENAAINIKKFAFDRQNLVYRDVAERSAPVPGGTRKLTLGESSD